MSKLTRCKRCGRRLRNRCSEAADRWAVVLVPPPPLKETALICPDCQTSGEYSEMTVNGATLVPARLGRLVPKT